VQGDPVIHVVAHPERPHHWQLAEVDMAEEPQEPAGERHKVALTDSAKIQALPRASAGLQRSLRTEEFSIVGIFDVN
jgi:hypothetical protein